MKQIKLSPHRRFTPACGISPRHHTPKRTVFYIPAEPEQNFTVEVLCEKNVFKIPTTYNYCWADWNSKLHKDKQMSLRTSSRPPEDWLELLSDSLHRSGYQVIHHVTGCENNQRLLILHFSVHKPAEPARYIKQNKAP